LFDRLLILFKLCFVITQPKWSLRFSDIHIYYFRPLDLLKRFLSLLEEHVSVFVELVLVLLKLILNLFAFGIFLLSGCLAETEAHVELSLLLELSVDPLFEDGQTTLGRLAYFINLIPVQSILPTH
jgi:hypothetical protein